jgi:hypothetical protein
MFSLFKLAIDAGMAVLIFYGGIKAQQNYPNLIANFGNAFSWLKSLLGKL